MLRDLIREIVGREPDMEIVGEVSESAKLVAVARETGAEFVIAGLDDSDLPTAYRALLDERPGMKVLGLAGDGQVGVLFDLAPRKVDLGEVSPGSIVTAIRAGTNAPGAMSLASRTGVPVKREFPR